MKITISKSQWQEMGKKAGWMKKKAEQGKLIQSIPSKINIYYGGSVAGSTTINGMTLHLEYANGMSELLPANSEIGGNIWGVIGELFPRLFQQKDMKDMVQKNHPASVQPPATASSHNQKHLKAANLPYPEPKTDPATERELDKMFQGVKDRWAISVKLVDICLQKLNDVRRTALSGGLDTTEALEIKNEINKILDNLIEHVDDIND
jgi:hypothetical protein